LCHWNFSLTLSFRPHYEPAVELLTQPLKEMNTRADKFTTFMCHLS